MDLSIVGNALAGALGGAAEAGLNYSIEQQKQQWLQQRDLMLAQLHVQSAAQEEQNKSDINARNAAQDAATKQKLAQGEAQGSALGKSAAEMQQPMPMTEEQKSQQANQAATQARLDAYEKARTEETARHNKEMENLTKQLRDTQASKASAAADAAAGKQQTAADRDAERRAKLEGSWKPTADDPSIETNPYYPGISRTVVSAKPAAEADTGTLGVGNIPGVTPGSLVGKIAGVKAPTPAVARHYEYTDAKGNAIPEPPMPNIEKVMGPKQGSDSSSGGATDSSAKAAAKAPMPIDTWLAQAKVLNPNKSEKWLRDKYNTLYGSGQ